MGGAGGGPSLLCGNGVIDPGELCDDGNISPADGCDAQCSLEPGTTCGDAIDLLAMGTKQGDVLVYDGTTTGSPVVGFGSPTCSGGGMAAPAVVHRYVTGPTYSRLTFETTDVGGALDDTVLWAYLDCLDTQNEHACDDDGGDGPLSFLQTAVLPPYTPVFLVLSGYAAADVGAYQLRVTEDPFDLAANSGTCAMPAATSGGSYAGATLASDSAVLSASCTGQAPEAVYAVTLTQPSDIVVRATPFSSDYDIGVYLLDGCAANPVELACADSQIAGYSESFSLTNVPMGTYHVVVDGLFAADIGAYGLEIGVRPVIAPGMPCDLSGELDRCADGAACLDLGMGPKCTSVTTLLAEDFTADLPPFAVVDAFADGKTFHHCDPEAGCPQENITKSASGGPYALVKDEDNVSLDGEALVSPTLDASAYSKVFLEFDHAFDHWPLATDLARVDVSVMSGPWTTVATYTSDAEGHVRLDLSPLVAGKTFSFRFYYDDQTSGGDSFAEEWRIDDVLVHGL